ncbi:MAG: methionyl-tRNA formyltransferase [Elusimicrobia bacterium]|nr:methionyl-tRNA formyltransferase [Elusimicrobiota bacterium]
MRYQKVAILTSRQSWLVPYLKKFVNILRSRKHQAKLFFNQKNINKSFNIVFALSYFSILDKEFLNKHENTFVVHESNLPKGRGWAPLFWQILHNKKKIPIVLFRVSEKLDRGDIYLKDFMFFRGDELHDEIREEQANKTMEMCLKLLETRHKLRPKKQTGKCTFYRKRTSRDSELNINKTIKKQFNLLRLVNNNHFPAFFYYKGHKYILKISR